jgi:hypothetical protein
MSTSLISLLASIAAYPFDTAKRRYQVLSIVDVNVSESVVYKGKYRYNIFKLVVLECI